MPEIHLTGWSLHYLLTEIDYVTMNDWRFLAWPLDAQKLTQQIN